MKNRLGGNGNPEPVLCFSILLSCYDLQYRGIGEKYYPQDGKHHE